MGARPVIARFRRWTSHLAGWLALDEPGGAGSWRGYYCREELVRHETHPCRELAGHGWQHTCADCGLRWAA